MTAARRTSTWLAGAVALALGLSACGGSGSSSDGPRAPDRSTTPSTRPDEGRGWTASPRETGIKVEMRNGRRLRARQPDRAGGRGLARRRLRHRELPGDVAGRQQGPLRAGRRRRRSPRCPDRYAPATGNWTGFAARSHRARLQPRQAAGGRAADVDHGPGRAAVEGQGRASRRPAPTSRPSSARCSRSRARGDQRLARRAEDERQDLPGQQRGHEGRQRRRDRGRDHLPLLLVQGPGRVRGEQQATSSCTTSASRTRAPSSASRAPACCLQRPPRPRRSSSCGYMTGRTGQQALAEQHGAGVHASPRRAGQPGAQAARRARARPTSTSPSSTARRSST